MFSQITVINIPESVNYIPGIFIYLFLRLNQKYLEEAGTGS